MIEQVMWPHDYKPIRNEPESAFIRGKYERPLRITFHSASFTQLPPEEVEALRTVRQLAHLPEIEAIDTTAGSFPYLEISNGMTDESIDITVNSASGSRSSRILDPQFWLKIATRLLNQRDSTLPEVQSLLTDLLVARAHFGLGQDILITLSPHLLKHRTEPLLRGSNLRTPAEASQILGLFLRSRDNYTWNASEHVKQSMNRGLFYWVLMRHRLPNMWRYFSACVAAARVSQNDIDILGWSILSRCVRALKARDYIGTQFYLRQNNDTRDAIMYHFDYLTLLLSGAFDALARVAHRAYKIDKFKEKGISFRHHEFIKTIKLNGATELYCIVSGQHFTDIMALLQNLRNTIHGANLMPMGVGDSSRKEESYISIPANCATSMWQAAQRCGSVERWGLIELVGILLEPYSFAVALVSECYDLVNKIAAATDINGLFPDGYDIPPLQDRPPDKDDTFSEYCRSRLALLG